MFQQVVRDEMIQAVIGNEFQFFAVAHIVHMHEFVALGRQFRAACLVVFCAQVGPITRGVAFT